MAKSYKYSGPIYKKGLTQKVGNNFVTIRPLEWKPEEIESNLQKFPWAKKYFNEGEEKKPQK